MGTAPEIANDGAQIADGCDLVSAACPCASYDGTKGHAHGDYVKCAKTVIKAQVPSGLRDQCVGTMKKIYGKSSCGTSPSSHVQPCVKRVAKSGAVSCVLKKTTQKDGVTPVDGCRSTAAATAVLCPTAENCLDAADSNGNLRIDAGDSGSCAGPAPSQEVQLVDCCVNSRDSFDCHYAQATNSCECAFLPSGPVSCEAPPAQVPVDVPVGYPPAALPSRGAMIPSAPLPQASYCDYFYCYVYDAPAATWSSVPRDTAEPSSPGPTLPSPATSPPDPASPFRPIDYCDQSFCYERGPNGYWTAYYRFGSEVRSQQEFTSTSFSGEYYYFTRIQSSWVPTPYDPLPGLPSAPVIPDSAPAPVAVPPGTPPLPFCQGEWCYLRNHFGVWFAHWIGSGS